MFGLLILLHELGHFTMARLFGVPVIEFSIGMGPRLFKLKSEQSGTEYSIRALPFGGYVSMEGEGNESDNPNSYSKKPVWQRMLILVAGPIMNIIIAIVLMFGIVFSAPYLHSTVIAEFVDGSTSNSETGLMLEDKIVKVGWVPVVSGQELVYEIAMQGYEPIDITVVRNGETIVLKDVTFGITEESGLKMGTPDFKVYAMNKTVPRALLHATTRSFSTFKAIIDSLATMISGRVGTDAIQGPIGITGEIVEMEKQDLMDISTFIYLASMISMNLGIFNLLPIPGLDGGQLVFRFIELIRRRPVNEKVETMINAGMIIILLALSALIAFKDVLNLFVN